MNHEKVKHASDCAVHNMPAMPAGPCDCGAEPPRHGPESEGDTNSLVWGGGCGVED